MKSSLSLFNQDQYCFTIFSQVRLCVMFSPEFAFVVVSEKLSKILLKGKTANHWKLRKFFEHLVDSLAKGEYAAFRSLTASEHAMDKYASVLFL
jgi:hypothetical protein